MRRRWWACALGVAAAIGVSTGSAATLAETGRIVLRGEGEGTVHYVAQGPGIPGTYEDDCPDACVVDWPLEGVTITLTATPVYNSRFGGWGGRCAPAGANRSCTFTGTAGLNLVEARFDPPKPVIKRPPLRGTTTVLLSASFVTKLQRQAWKLRAIAPATLQGRTLTLPIAPSGPLTIVRKSTPLIVEKVEGRCDAIFPPGYVIHHAGGILLSRPGGRLNRLPLDKPALSFLTGSPSLLFRDGARPEHARW
jgi:hypothetical protein